MSIDKAIILSAGQGSRLLPLTRDIPKCLIEFNGRSLISWQVAALVANGIKDIVVVTGFRTERVEDHALQLYRDTGARIRTLFNPFFQVADNLGTCWIAREEMDRDFIILNGDTIVSDEIVAKLIEGASEPINVTVDVKGEYDDDDMKVNRDAEGRLHAIGKRLLPPDTNAESIGMLAFIGDGPSGVRIIWSTWLFARRRASPPAPGRAGPASQHRRPSVPRRCVRHRNAAGRGNGRAGRPSSASDS